MKSISTPPLLSPFVLPSSVSLGNSVAGALQDILRTIRQHLGMDVAFLSRFADGKRIFQYVDTLHANHPVKVGGADPLEESYCQRIVDGRLPELIRDAAMYPAAAELPVTAALPVGAHLSVPIKLSDGRIYGTFCCFSHAADHSLTERDLHVMRAFADLAAKQIEQDIATHKERQEIEQRIKSILDSDNPSIVYQPIFHLAQNRIVGFESLSRFTASPLRTPDVWFNEAAKVGLGVALETKAIQTALQGLKYLPDSVYVTINASPETILSGAIASTFKDMPLNRLVLEVTEHALIDRYEDLAAAICSLRERGMQVAVDDAGAGYASFRHILNLAPDIIKLDISLTRNIDSDRSRRALAAALTRFAEETGSKIVAEGVETAAKLHVLQEIGINKAQGYLLGRPVSINEASQLCRQRSATFPQSVSHH